MILLDVLLKHGSSTRLFRGSRPRAGEGPVVRLEVGFVARILVADDEDGVRALYKLWLGSEGHQVSEARDGVEAKRLLGDEQYDLAVIDLVMPRLDGISVIKGLQSGGGSPKVLAISAGNGNLPAGVGLPLSSMFGADEVLYKPFARSELIAAVGRLLG